MNNCVSIWIEVGKNFVESSSYDLGNYGNKIFEKDHFHPFGSSSLNEIYSVLYSYLYVYKCFVNAFFLEIKCY